MGRPGQGRILGRFGGGGWSVPHRAVWAGGGLAGSAEPGWHGGALLVWVAEQVEKMEMSLSERKRQLRSAGEGGAVFRGPAGQGCLPASPLALSPMANPSASMQFPPQLSREVQQVYLSSAHVAELGILPGDDAAVIMCASKLVRLTGVISVGVGKSLAFVAVMSIDLD